jgi:hypothetical protein
MHLRGRRTFIPIEEATRPTGVLCGMGWGDQVPLNGSGVYAPLAIRAPEDGPTARGATVFPAYFQLLLHNAIFLKQIVVFSEVLQLVHKGQA